MRTTQINRKIMDNIYGNQCGSDNAFTRKARLLQSMYRVEIGEEEGFGPTRASKRKYGNMISGGEVSGKNFLMKETFEYAKERRSQGSAKWLISAAEKCVSNDWT